MLSFLSILSKESEKSFGLIFMLVWAGSVIVTLNTRFLGGSASIFQSVSVLGYCVFPLVIPTIIFVFYEPPTAIKGAIVGGAFIWSCASSLAFMGDIVPEHRRTLGAYPVILFYIFIAWIIFLA
eukprot:TRINITY_DN11027_c0_g1_i2.p1 TRINITY_DN11027_c0_g1~~TRINITY_DN11027_c0_g1_i2.p1  ORF type:complete len:124 (+),score=18.80 TRINITY_DN11027_c0_g1_i2:228-599(+)